MDTLYGFRFSIEKLGSGAFAEQAWKRFWSLVKPADIPASTLHAATLIGTEGVYVIYLESNDSERLARVAEKVGGNRHFLEVAVSPGVTTELEGQPLEAGRVTPEGEFVGGSWAEAGLRAARDQVAPIRLAPSRAGTRRRMVWASAVVAFLLAGGAISFALLRSQARQEPKGAPATKGSPAANASPSPSESPSPSPPPPPVDTRDISTAAGVLRIEKVSLSDKYMDCPPSGGECKDIAGPPYLIVLVRSAEGKSGEAVSDGILQQATESFVVDSRGARADFDTVRRTGASRSVEVIYAEFDSTKVTGLVLHWPQNSPIILHPA